MSNSKDLERPIFKGYCEIRTMVLLHLGWRIGEGPRLDMTFGFHAAPVGQLGEADLGGKLVLQGGAMRARYEMELPMLVDVVQGVEVPQAFPDVTPVLPSVVWLKKTDRLPLRLVERLNVGAPIVAELRNAIKDRELAHFLDIGVNDSIELPDVELIDEVVECGAQIEHDLSDDQGPLGLDARQLAQVEAVLQSAPVFFGPHGPGFAWRPDRLDMALEYSELTLCPGQLRDWPFEAPRHAHGG